MNKKTYYRPCIQIMQVSSQSIICASKYMEKGGSNDELDTDENGYYIAG